MITKLVLDNWRSHDHSEFEFDKGTNVLVGAMGSGKTSAMDGICFALFGTFPSLQSRKLKLDDVIMSKPEQKNGAGVTIEITINSEQYVIKRKVELGKGVTLSEIRKNDMLIEGPQTQRTTEKVCDLLKINYELFARAVYAEQNNMEYFLEIPKGQRKQKIDELLGISKFEQARKNLNPVINRIKDRTEEKLRFIKTSKEIEQILGLEQDINSKKMRLQEIQNKKQLVQKEHSGLAEKYNELKGKKERFEELDSEIKESRGKVEQLNTRLETFGEITETEENARQKLGTLKELRRITKEKQEMKDLLEKQIEKSGALVGQNKKMIEEYKLKMAQVFIEENIQKMQKETKEQIENMSGEIENVIGDKKSLELQQAEIREHVHDLAEFDKCPTCYTKLTPEKKNKIVEERRRKIHGLEKEKQVLEKRILEMDSERKRLKEKLEKIREEMKKIEEKKWIEENIKKIELELVENQELLNKSTEKLLELKIEKSIEDIDTELKVFEKVVEYFDTKNDLKKIKELIDGWKSEIVKLRYEPVMEKEVFEKLKEVEKNIALLTQEEKNGAELIAEKQKRLDELKKIKEEIERTIKETQYLTKINESFMILQNVLQDAQAQLRQNFTDTTNMALTDVWTRIYPYGDYRGLKLGVDEAGDYILQLSTRAEDWVNVEGISSGGERSTASLALRIALSLVLTQNLSWLVLDEPTHNLDKEAVMVLATTLREHLPEIVDQIFIITHEPLLEEAASAYLYRLERKKELDEPTKITIEKKIGS